jgi:rubrerythrin
MPQAVAALSPLHIIRYALHNEQRTYALFLRIAASTHVSEIRHQAELLASEELEHVALLSRRELELEDAQTHPAEKCRNGLPPVQRNIDSIRSIAATEAWVSAARRTTIAAHLRARGDRWSAAFLQDLAETSEARCRALGVDTPLKEIPHALLPHNDNQPTPQILACEAQSTREAGHGFLRMASNLGTNGLAAFTNHEANLRLGTLALLHDHLACLQKTPFPCQSRGA